jgi:hypothetical protein
MSELIITGTKPPGLQTIAFARFLHDNFGMSIQQIKRSVAELKDFGKEIRLSGLSEERALALRQEAESINAVCR